MGYDAAVAALTPQLFYKLDEASGSTATDSGALGLNGTYSGTPTRAQPTLYPLGTASTRCADGNSAYVTITGASALGSWSGYSCAGWWKATDSTVTDPYLFMMGWSGGNSIPICIGTNSNGSGKFTAGCFDGSSWHYVTGTTTIVAGNTYFVAATLSSKTSGTLRLYVNGVEEGTASTGLNVGGWSYGTLYLGHQWDSSGMSTGTYQGWAAWDSALSGGQIAALYAAASVPPPRQLPGSVRRPVTVQQRSRRF